jgi:uncharacterized protein YprB with RNaseH-like and TPR domain
MIRNPFQLPALKAHFDSFPTPAAHLDLRFVCRRVGFSGGLKQIEDRLGFGRPPHLKGIDGWDAVILWRIYGRDLDLEALRFLVEYNLYDCALDFEAKGKRWSSICVWRLRFRFLTFEAGGAFSRGPAT